MSVVCLLVSNDARLCAKAGRLFAKHPEMCVQAADFDYVQTVLESAYSKDEPLPLILLDLDAALMSPYALAARVRAAMPDVRLIAFALSTEPGIIQQARLHGITEVVQHFKAEELLREIASASAQR